MKIYSITSPKVLKMAMKENIYSLAFRNQYDMMASEAARDIFQSIINGKKDFYKSYPKYNIEIFADIKTSNDDYIQEDFLSSKRFNIEAKNNAEFEEEKITWSEISIVITLAKSFTKIDYESLNYAIYEAIRHELEHHKTFTEIGRPDQDYKDILEKVFNVSRKEAYKNCGIIAQYITHSQELPSNARSLYFLAKKEKKDYNVVIEEFINRVFFNNDPEKIKVGKEDKDISGIINSVRNKIIDRIKYFFPNTMITMRSLPY